MAVYSHGRSFWSAGVTNVRVGRRLFSLLIFFVVFDHFSGAHYVVSIYYIKPFPNDIPSCHG